MDEATVLNTFETYREDLDRLFKEREKKYHTISYMSIDHCHTMDILNKTIRDNMIKKLREVYSKSGVSCLYIIIVLIFTIRLIFSLTVP